MRVVAYDPFVSADKARADGCRAAVARPGDRRGRLRHDPPAEDQGDDGSHQSRPVAEGQADDAADQRCPRRHRRRDSELAEAIRDGVIAGAALDVFATEPTTESPLFGISIRSSSRRTSGRRPARHRTRPATPSPTWCSWRSPASSCRSPSTSTRPRRTRRCDRSCRSPSDSAGSSPRWSPAGAGRAAADRGLHRGRHRRVRHAHPHAGRVEGLLRLGHRRAGHLRQRTTAGQGSRCRGPRDELRDVGRLRQPHHVPRWRASRCRARWSVVAASSGS